MAERGDVCRLHRRLGFGSPAAAEHVVVIQATALCSALPTLVVVPLDPDESSTEDSLSVRIAPAESGAAQDLYALPSQPRALVADRLAPGRVGRLRRRTLAELDQKLRLVLDL